MKAKAIMLKLSALNNNIILQHIIMGFRFLKSNYVLLKLNNFYMKSKNEHMLVYKAASVRTAIPAIKLASKMLMQCDCSSKAMKNNNAAAKSNMFHKKNEIMKIILSTRITDVSFINVYRNLLKMKSSVVINNQFNKLIEYLNDIK